MSTIPRYIPHKNVLIRIEKEATIGTLGSDQDLSLRSSGGNHSSESTGGQNQSSDDLESATGCCQSISGTSPETTISSQEKESGDSPEDHHQQKNHCCSLQTQQSSSSSDSPNNSSKPSSPSEMLNFSHYYPVVSGPVRSLSSNCVRPLVICGPSGSGKSTLLKKLMSEFSDYFGFSVSRELICE